MIDAENMIRTLGIKLPDCPIPVATYVPSVKTGNLVFISGQIPVKDGEVVYAGKLGQEISIAQGYEASQLAGMRLLACLKAEIGNLNRVERIVRLTGLVNSDEAFIEHPSVINGASDLMLRIFGDRGKHTRVAYGVAALPRNAAVEIDMIVQISS